MKNDFYRLIYGYLSAGFSGAVGKIYVYLVCKCNNGNSHSCLFRRDLRTNQPTLPAGMIPPCQNLGAVQMAAQNVAGAMNPARPALPSTGVSSQQTQEIRQQQALALMSLLQGHLGTQQGQIQLNQPPIMGLHDLYQFLMSQGSRVYYTQRQ